MGQHCDRAFLRQISFAIQFLREQKGLSQSEMAEKMGVPLRSYQNWELGIRDFPICNLLPIALALEVEPAKLLLPAPPEWVLQAGKRGRKKLATRAAFLGD